MQKKNDSGEREAKIKKLGLVGGANLAYGHCRQAVKVDYIDGTKLPH